MPELSIEITGKIDSLKKSLKEAEQLLGETEKSTEGTDKALGGLKKTSKTAGNEIGKLGSKSAELQRIFKDTEVTTSDLVDSVQYLITSFGSAGLTLAVIGAFAVLITYNKEAERAGRLTKSLDEATKKLVGSVQSEVTFLKALVTAARNENLSKQARLRAVTKINDLYKDYLPNLSLEEINTNKVTKSIDLLTSSLLRQAKARGAQSVIEEKSKELFLEISRINRNAATVARQEVSNGVKAARSRIRAIKAIIPALEEQEKKGADVALGLASLRVELLQLEKSATSAGKKLRQENFLEELINKSEVSKDLKDLSELFQSFVNEDLEIGGILTFTPPDVSNLKDKFKNNFRNLDDIYGINEGLQRSLNSGEGLFKAIEIRFDKFGRTIGGALDYPGKLVPVQLSIIEQALIDFNDNANDIIQNNIANTFAGIGDAIGSALTEGANLGEALAKTLLNSVGAMLVQLGELAISTGVGILAINTALNSLNPYVAIAAGIALVALGAAVSSSASKIGSSGGTGSGSSSVAGQGKTSGNSFSGGNASSLSTSTGGEFIFRIRGRELIGVIENELTATRRLGGVGTLGG